MTNLSNIRHTIQNISEAIAAVIDADVTIIDKDFIRIAGTGSYSSLIGQQVPRNSLVCKLYDTKKPIFMKGKNINTYCQNCQRKESCLELASVAFPIFYKQEIIGSIWIIAFQEEQKEIILEKQGSFELFLQRMSMLIENTLASEAMHTKQISEANLIYEIIQNINDGVIVVDPENKIKLINNQVYDLLGLQDSCIGNKFNDIIRTKTLVDFHKKVEGQRDIWALYNSKYDIFYSVIPMSHNFIANNSMIIFRRVDAILDLAKDLEKASEYTGNIIGESKAMKVAKSLVIKAAKSDATVLLLGETGTGKELFARSLHNLSNRYDRPFIAINCASIPENLLESELFGYEKGAFTGALSSGKKGKFEVANGGTVFLDEIGDMPLTLQPKLLRVLQERTVERIGGCTSKNIDVRIIAATNKDLEQEVLDGRFREDLFFRINVIPINIPPLRERRSDILLYINYFLDQYCNELKIDKLDIKKEVYSIFQSYSWPGNIRELENVIEYAVNMCDGSVIEVEDLPPYIKQKNTNMVIDASNLSEMLEQYEKMIIKEMLDEYGSTKKAKELIAGKLGIGIATLYRKIHKHCL